MTQKHLFLDLEDTVIEPVPFGWGNAFLINIPKVKRFIAEFKPDEVHLFSFAIHNAHELKQFNYHVRSRLEDALGVSLNLCPTVDDDIIPTCCANLNIASAFVSFSDMIEFWGKQGAFRLFVAQTFKARQDTTVALLDDVVTDEDFTFHSSSLKGFIRNIDQLD